MLWATLGRRCGWWLGWCLVVSPAFADGGIWIRDEAVTATAGTSDQRAVLVYDPGTQTETMVLSTRYQGELRDFAWLIPVPGTPQLSDVGTWADGVSVLNDLYQITEPRAVVTVTSGGGGCGGGGGSSSSTTYGATANVRLNEWLNIDDLYLAVLAPQVTDELTVWLTRNGYATSAQSRAILEFYVQKGWGFVAVKVDPTPLSGTRRPSWPEGETTGYFPQWPLKLQFQTDQFVFPLRISQVSTIDERVDVVLYAIAPYRVQVDTYPTFTIAPPQGDYGTAAEFETAYANAFEAALQAGNGRSFVVEAVLPLASRGVHYAGDIGYDYDLRGLLPDHGQWYLTRLRSSLLGADMTNDVVLTQAPTNTGVEVYFADARSALGAWPLTFAGLGGWLQFLLWRRRGRSGVGAAVVTGLVILLLAAGL